MAIWAPRGCCWLRCGRHILKWWWSPSSVYFCAVGERSTSLRVWNKNWRSAREVLKVEMWSSKLKYFFLYTYTLHIFSFLDDVMNDVQLAYSEWTVINCTRLITKCNWKKGEERRIFMSLWEVEKCLYFVRFNDDSTEEVNKYLNEERIMKNV